MGKMPELLAPAGSRAAFAGAVSAGADAVYLGGTKFGARAYAENFTTEEIIRSLDEAHLLGKKIYVTANTLLKDEELGETVSFVCELYEHGLDGVIIQDLGLLTRLAKACPGLPLHASTQMSVTLPEGVRLLQDMGCVRVVPARELSLAEIRRLKEETGVEVEAFIHGAMCYAYSGRCLMSSYLGGRSGNRGRCAGTCRLPYRILDESGSPVGADARRQEYYPLSMRDMCVLEILPDLIDAGIDSFKIEGRMKKPEYAAGVTAVYRKYLDRFAQWEAQGRPGAWKIEREDMHRLQSLYLRTDLSTGYYKRRNGRSLLTIGAPGYTGADEKVLDDVRGKFLREMPRRKVEGEAVFHEGEPACLTIRDASGPEQGAAVSVTVYGEMVQRSVSRPMRAEDLKKRLEKTGDTLFSFTALKVNAQEGIFMTVSAVNALRRQALEAFEKKVLEGFQRRLPETTASRDAEEAIDNSVKMRKNTRQAIWADVCTPQQLRAALRAGADHVILEDISLLEAAGDLLRAGSSGTAFHAALPHIFRESSRQIAEETIQWAQRNGAGLLVRTPDELRFAHESGFAGRITADSSLYAWNRDSLAALTGTGNGCGDVVLPLELSARDLEALTENNPEVQYLLTVYGRAPLMITAGCVRMTEKQCTRSANKSRIRKNGEREDLSFWQISDRKKINFPVMCNCRHCYNVIYNSLPTSLHKLERTPAACDALMVFTTEEGMETEALIRWFSDRQGAFPIKEYTNGHIRRSAL